LTTRKIPRAVEDGSSSHLLQQLLEIAPSPQGAEFRVEGEVSDIAGNPEKASGLELAEQSERILQL
jgi:hypothetical protein